MSPSAPKPGPTFDLVVIGAGSAGHAAALEAAALGRRVAIVERSPDLGGAAIRPGALAGATLRASAMELTGATPAGGRRSHRADGGSVRDLLWRLDGVLDRARQAARDRLRRARVEVVAGHATLADAGTIRVDGPGGRTTLRAHRVLIAVGRRPGLPRAMDTDGRTVLDVDGIPGMRRVPGSLTVVGAAAPGLEYASIFAALGARVTVVERRGAILAAADEQIASALEYHLRGLGVSFRLGHAVARVEPGPHGATWACADGASGTADAVLVTTGRVGATDSLGLDAVGIATDTTGRIPVDEGHRTSCPAVFAAGDVARGPALPMTAQEQGRVAARVACDAHGVQPHTPAPASVLTIPEVAFAGSRERDLAEMATPYERGLAHYRDLLRGDIAGDRVGLLKLLVHRETRRLLGVHIFGTAAGELVHVGQMVMAAGLPVDHLAEGPYAEPAFAEAYRAAAIDAVRRMSDVGEARPLGALSGHPA